MRRNRCGKWGPRHDRMTTSDYIDRGRRLIDEPDLARLLHVELALGPAAVGRNLDEIADQLLHARKIRADLVDLCLLRRREGTRSDRSRSPLGVLVQVEQ